MDGEVSRNLKDGIYIVVWLARPKPWINKLEEPGLNIMESKLDCWRSPVSQMPFESFHFPKQKSPNLRRCPQKNSLELKKLLMFPFLTELCQACTTHSINISWKNLYTFWNESTYLLKSRVVKSEWENVNCPEQVHLVLNHFGFRAASFLWHFIAIYGWLGKIYWFRKRRHEHLRTCRHVRLPQTPNNSNDGLMS